MGTNIQEYLDPVKQKLNSLSKYVETRILCNLSCFYFYCIMCIYFFIIGLFRHAIFFFYIFSFWL